MKRIPWIASTLWSLALITLGVWQLYGRSVRGIPAVIAWGFIVIGAIGLALRLFMGSRFLTTPEDAARQQAELHTQLYSGAHEYRGATATDMRGLDSQFYESATKALTTAGFRYLGDVVDVTGARASSWARTVIRVMLSSDGTAMGGIFHVKLSGLPRVLQFLGVISRNMRILSLETELDDGTFVTTGNDRESNTTTEFPGVARRQLPVLTAPDVLTGAHRQHVADALLSKGAARPLTFRTLQEVLDSQNRLEELKSAHRSAPTFDHRAELERNAGRPLTKQELELAERLNDLQSGRGASDGPPPPNQSVR